ncbi:MAG: GTPase ObgE [Deltaproteobacteria bacterium]|nr:GTPase ObgE [Deltaproteobacteria bacterium]
MDRAKIWVKSGHGGPGCVSFRRERYVPKGGPDGGDGGRGGDVVVVAGDQRETLLRYRFNQHFSAKNGSPGMGKNRTGESADDLVLKVPAGTAVIDAETGVLLADLPGAGDSFTVCRGGRGGQGNARFASPGFRTPRFAQPGGDFEEKRIVLELRLLADAALVGYPNVGKSSLISRLSAATPKVADYPFTTLAPVLGTVSVGDSSYVIADLPGLIDGASEGLGLGHEFLRHVSRAGALLHVLDPTRLNPEEPLKDLESIRLELKRYEPSMLRKPQLLAISKMDLPEGPPALRALSEALPGERILAFSSVTREGLDDVRYAVWNEVKAMREREAAAAAAAKAKEEGRAAPGGIPRESPTGRGKTFSSRADALAAASAKLKAAGSGRFSGPGASGLPGLDGLAGPPPAAAPAAPEAPGPALGTAGGPALEPGKDGAATGPFCPEGGGLAEGDSSDAAMPAQSQAPKAAKPAKAQAAEAAKATKPAKGQAAKAAKPAKGQAAKAAKGQAAKAAKPAKAQAAKAAKPVAGRKAATAGKAGKKPAPAKAPKPSKQSAKARKRS